MVSCQSLARGSAWFSGIIFFAMAIMLISGSIHNRTAIGSGGHAAWMAAGASAVTVAQMIAFILAASADSTKDK